jgi:hypothetical protein
LNHVLRLECPTCLRHITHQASHGQSKTRRFRSIRVEWEGIRRRMNPRPGDLFRPFRARRVLRLHSNKTKTQAPGTLSRRRPRSNSGLLSPESDADYLILIGNDIFKPGTLSVEPLWRKSNKKHKKRPARTNLETRESGLTKERGERGAAAAKIQYAQDTTLARTTESTRNIEASKSLKHTLSIYPFCSTVTASIYIWIFEPERNLWSVGAQGKSCFSGSLRYGIVSPPMCPAHSTLCGCRRIVEASMRIINATTQKIQE